MIGRVQASDYAPCYSLDGMEHPLWTRIKSFEAWDTVLTEGTSVVSIFALQVRDHFHHNSQAEALKVSGR